MRPHTGIDPSGLIELPEPADDAWAASGVARAVTAVFAVLVLGTLGIDAAFPMPPPPLVGREAAEEARLHAEAKLSDGSWARMLERDRRLRSRVRGWVNDPYALALYRWLGEAGDRVVVGRDGWMFLQNQVELPTLARRDEESLLGSSAALFATLERFLDARGIEMVALPAPRKSAVCAAFLPPGMDPDAGLDARLVDAVAARGVPVVDLPRLFAEHDPAELYFRRGTHWTEVAADLAAREIARLTGLLVPAAARATRIERVPMPAARQDMTLLFNVGLGLDESRAEALKDDVVALDVVDADGSPLEARFSDPIRRIELIGTSFTHSYQLGPLLEHYVGEPVGVFARDGHLSHSALSRMMARARAEGRLPELLVFEQPNQDTFSRDPWPACGEALQDLLPLATIPLGGATVELAVPRGERVPVRRPVTLANLPAGTAFHTGDGVLALRVRGQVLDELGVQLEVRPDLGRGAASARAYPMRAHWSPQRPELLMPVVLGRPGAPAVTVEIAPAPRKQAAVRVQSIDWVVVLDPTTRVDARASGPVTAAGGWSLRLAFPDGTRVPAHGALVVTLGEAPGGPLELALEGPADATALRVEPAARIVLSLDAQAGAPLAAAVLRGSGAPPAPADVRAFLAGTRAR